jgi:hypothetical protein
MFRFNKNYFLLTLLLFITEVLIGAYVNDAIIRPYVGDYLVVILMYCFVRSFLQLPVVPLAIGVLLFSYCIEVLQYFNLVDHLGLRQYKLAVIVIGSSFEWIDMVAYTLGIATVIVVEKYRVRRVKTKPGG